MELHYVHEHQQMHAHIQRYLEGGNLLALHMQQRMQQDAADWHPGTCFLPPALLLSPETKPIWNNYIYQPGDIF